MLRHLYSLGWLLAVPLAIAYLLYRSVRQPAYRRHWPERFGFAKAAAPGNGPIWVHAVSVGETVAAAPLVRELASRHPERPLLLTHATPTGRATGGELFRALGPRLTQCYLPYDLPCAVDRFLARQRPACGLVMETEVWPNLMHAARRRGVPMAVVNARLSPRSLARGQMYRGLIAPAIAAFDVIVAQTEADSERMSRLGRGANAVSGNLKFDQAVAPDARERGARWRQLLGERPVVVAASTRDGEEALLLAAWRDRVAAGDRVPLLVVVPRHPDRFEIVANLMAQALATAAPGARLMRRADLESAAPGLAQAPLLLGDSMGEMQRWYACADAVIMGGSLLPFGSQNLIEANALGCPVVLGPSTFNFEQAASEAIAAGAAVQAPDASAAFAVALRIAGDPAERGNRSGAALAFTQAHRGATERTLAALEAWLGAALRPPR